MQPPPLASSPANRTLIPAYMTLTADLDFTQILPFETWQAVLIHLRPKDLAACRLAGRTWQRMVHSQYNLSRILHLTKAMTTFKPALAPQFAAMQQEMQTALLDSTSYFRGITCKAWVWLRDTIACDDELLNGRFFQTYGSQDVCRNVVLRKKLESGDFKDRPLLTLVTDALQAHAVKDAQEMINTPSCYFEHRRDAVVMIVQYYTDHGQLDAAINYLTQYPFPAYSLRSAYENLVQGLAEAKRYQDALTVSFRLFEDDYPFHQFGGFSLYSVVSTLFKQQPNQQERVRIVRRALNFKSKHCPEASMCPSRTPTAGGSQLFRIKLADALLNSGEKDLTYQVLQFRPSNRWCQDYLAVAIRFAGLLNSTDEPVMAVRLLVRARCDLNQLRRILEKIVALNYSKEKLEQITEYVDTSKSTLPTFWKRLLQSHTVRMTPKAPLPKKAGDSSIRLDALLRDTPADKLEGALKSFLVQESKSSPANEKEKKIIALAKRVAATKGHYDLARRVVLNLLPEGRWQTFASQELLKVRYSR